MNRRPFLASFCLMIIVTHVAAADDPRFGELVPADAKVERLATGMKFTEGPVWTDADGGHLVFSDIPASELKKWTQAGGLTTWLSDSNQTNGNTRDRQGRLISCEHAARRVVMRHDAGASVMLVDRYDGKRFNSPNDAVVKSDGTIWFTDPTYGLGKQPK